MTLEELSQSIDKRFDKIEEKQDDFFNKMYIGNGKESFVVRIDRIERVIKKMCWFGCSIAVPISLKLIYDIMF